MCECGFGISHLAWPGPPLFQSPMEANFGFHFDSINETSWPRRRFWAEVGDTLGDTSITKKSIIEIVKIYVMI